jgi:hypothetical protein
MRVETVTGRKFRLLLIMGIFSIIAGMIGEAAALTDDWRSCGPHP